MKFKVLLSSVIFLFAVQWVMGQNVYKSEKYEFGASFGVWMQGTVDAKYSGDDPAGEDIALEKEATYLGRIFFDIVIGRQTSVGAFFNFSEFNFANSNASGTLRDMGLEFKYKFLMSKRFAIRPGIGVGYRNLGSSNAAVDNSGIAANLNIEFLYAITKNNMKLMADLGFLAQPYGTSSDYDVYFAPIPYLNLGIAF